MADGIAVLVDYGRQEGRKAGKGYIAAEKHALFS